MKTPLIKNPTGPAEQPLGNKRGYKSHLPLSQKPLKSKSCSSRTYRSSSTPQDGQTPHASSYPCSKQPGRAGISSTDLPKDGASLRAGFVAHSSLESLYSVRAGSKSGRETPTPRECHTHTEINSSLPKGMTQGSHQSLKHKSLLINPRKPGGRPSKRSTGQDLAFPALPGLKEEEG